MYNSYLFKILYKHSFHFPKKIHVNVGYIKIFAYLCPKMNCMKSIYTLKYAFLMLLAAFAVNAQSLPYDLSIKNLEAKDTVSMNSSMGIRFYLKNSGSTTFSGTLNVQYLFSTNTGINSPAGQTPYYSVNLSTITLHAGDSILVTDTIQISSSRFGGGNNIVIVWPKYQNNSLNDENPANDWAIHNIFVKSNSKVAPNSNVLYYSKSSSSLQNITAKATEKAKTITLYPNPATDYIQIENLSPGSTIAVLNTIGETLTTSKQGETDRSRIDLSELNKGVYILKVDDTRTVKYFKFIKK